MEEDNNIKVLEEMIQIYKQNRIGYFINNTNIQAIEKVIKRNKELQEYQHKVNEIMYFDEENLDSSRVNNNYIGLKNCVTQLKKQVEDSIPKSKLRELINKRGNNGYTSLDCVDDIEKLLQEEE